MKKFILVPIEVEMDNHYTAKGAYYPTFEQIQERIDSSKHLFDSRDAAQGFLQEADDLVKRRR